MKGNIDAIAKLAIAYFGDVPVSTVTKDRQKEFFVWMARLPKSHGKTHGKNRFCPDQPKNVKSKYSWTKQEEIEDADRIDEEIMADIRERTDLSDPEKRSLLAEQLTPRLTLRTIHRNRDGLNRLFRAANDLGDQDVPVAISYSDIKRQIDAAAPNDHLYVHVTHSKIRMPWTEERLSAFFTSPIYAGCSSPHRRAAPGPVVIRDAFYWVPLIVLTIGSRIEEILLLSRKNVILRNGVYCLLINKGSDQGNGAESHSRQYQAWCALC